MIRNKISKTKLQEIITKSQGDWDLLMFLLAEYFKARGEF